MADTARRAGRTLMRMLAGEVEPRMVWGNRPIMSSSLVHTPSREPMKTLMGMANQAEDTGQVLNASVFGGFPQADIPHLALSSVIVCDKRTAEGEVLLNKILDTAWEKREGFLFHPEPLSVQVARAKSLERRPGRHGRPRRQHRLGRHAGRDERDRGGDEAGPRGRLSPARSAIRPASSR